MKKERVNEIFAVLLFFVAIFVLASLLFHHPDDHPFFTSTTNQPIKNLTGLFGAYLSHYLFLSIGYSSYFIAGFFILWSVFLFMQQLPERKLFKVIGLVFFLAASSCIFGLSNADPHKATAGGLLGYFLSANLKRYFGTLGSYLISIFVLCLSFLLASEFLIFPLIKKVFMAIKSALTGHLLGLKEHIGSRIDEKLEEREAARKLSDKEKRKIEKKRLRQERKQQKQQNKLSEKHKQREDKGEEHSPFAKIPLKIKKWEPEKDGETQDASKKQTEKRAKKIFGRKQVASKSKEAVKENDKAFDVQVKKDHSSTHTNYSFPRIDILQVPQHKAGRSEEDLKEISATLEQTLKHFGIEIKVVEIEQGPVITRFEILPAPGVKVNSITNLEHDLALALKTTSIRFLTPIPGKSAMGIEIPNSTTNIVYLRELIESRAFKQKEKTLPLALGKNASGKPLLADLSGMPHLLIAGTTGSGKTVCVNSIIAGMLYSLSPDELKFVMIDPKMVELAVYNALPHMLSPVVTDIKKAAGVLNWVVTEMDNRYKLFASCGVRNIKSFNSRESTDEEKKSEAENGIPEKLPYIVVIIDELADLMMIAQDKVEAAITRLAQLSRAVGIHLILATQRPSVDVITGVIKANFPARISFKVASKVDSRTVLDANGADQLLGKGDMLFLEPGNEKPVRGQATLVSDKEINSIVNFIKNQADPEYVKAIQEIGEAKSEIKMEKDEMYDEAVRVVLQTGQASVSILQRRLRLGYTRAARIIDYMEAEGIVGHYQGSKARDILVDTVQTDVSGSDPDSEESSE